MAKSPQGSGNGVESQETRYLYESPIDGSWVTSTIYPDSSDTDSTGTDQEKCAYDRLGRKTTCTDQRGVVHTFTFDSAGRLQSDAVTTLPSGVDGVVRRIERGYDDLSRLQTVTSYDAASGGNIVNQVKHTYGAWGTVIKTEQAHDGAVTTGTPAVHYSYSDGASGGEAKYVRLNTVTYPGGRQIQNVYPSSGDSFVLARPNSIKDVTRNLTIAEYFWVGTDRYGEVRHPTVTDGLTLGYGHSSNLIGWDRFGRVVRQQWRKQGSFIDSERDRFDYTYDRNGNRLSREFMAYNNPQTLDEAYAYDGLNRLGQHRVGTLVGGTMAQADTLYDQTWGLDGLGNWRTNAEDADGNASGAAVTQTRTHNAANEILTNTGNTPAWATPAHDAAGNMTTVAKPGDEAMGLTLTYDAWNRLVKVQDAATSATIAEYEYDGTGGRIEKRIGGNTEDFFYNENYQVLEVRLNDDPDPHLRARVHDPILCARSDARAETRGTTRVPTSSAITLAPLTQIAPCRRAPQARGARTAT